MENMNIGEIRGEDEMEQYCRQIDAMTPDERKAYYENIRKCVEVMQSVLESFSQKWLDYCLQAISECAEDEDWEGAKHFMKISNEALENCYTETCHRTVWESLGDDVPETYMDSEFFRLLEKVRKLNGTNPKAD